MPRIYMEAVEVFEFSTKIRKINNEIKSVTFSNILVSLAAVFINSTSTQIKNK